MFFWKHVMLSDLRVNWRVKMTKKFSEYGLVNNSNSNFRILRYTWGTLRIWLISTFAFHRGNKWEIEQTKFTRYSSAWNEKVVLSYCRKYRKPYEIFNGRYFENNVEQCGADVENHIFHQQPVRGEEMFGLEFELFDFELQWGNIGRFQKPIGTRGLSNF